MELRYLFPPPPRIPVISQSGQSRHGGPLLELDEVACGLLGGYEIRFHMRYMRQKSDWLGLALEDGGSPYYKRGRGDRSAIDSESLLGWTVVTPLLNVALIIKLKSQM
ncbi:hypothetical protein M752DRAFT_263958 [Aspergillus phoenicis ATCC 13157]|uniref:Uncharacterized protein n=1 Tax=Aspergillus phoenicis ATCC 13157 TaxID=1353007 RepID=A0A370PSP5_ASPPH|nr:hypothetical protein M752DRAFT_263958 [Aspergillus phoenicis ATCC 13157]